MLEWLLLLTAATRPPLLASEANPGHRMAAHVSAARQLGTTIACRTYGLAIATQLTPGMTAQKANRIIGQLPVDGGQSFGHKAWFVYERYGFSVAYVRGPDGVRRVSTVELLPPF